MLFNSIRQVSLAQKDLDISIDEAIKKNWPRKGVHLIKGGDFRQNLEHGYLAPSQSFPTEWLNSLQLCIFLLDLAPKTIGLI